MVTKQQIFGQLAKVIDPELGLDIVNLGLVYEVKVGRKPKEKGKLQKVDIRMTFTTPACPLINEILEDVKNKLDIFEEADIEVHIVFDPLWTLDRMSEKAKIKLGMI